VATAGCCGGPFRHADELRCGAVAVDTTVNGEDRVRVECHICGLEFFASCRSARDYRAGRAEPRCILHRRRKGEREGVERAILRRFWLDRFTSEEIVDMAHALFPRGTGRGIPTALTAASRSQNGVGPFGR
jgi:hypothetical protein